MIRNNQTHLFSGTTLLPKDVPMYGQLLRTIAMFEIDVENEVVVRASFLTLIPHTNDFLCSIANGYDLKQGIEPLLAEINRRTHLPPTKAWMKAIEIAYQKYLDFKSSCEYSS